MTNSVLVVNDDGVLSPLLIAFLTKLADEGVSKKLRAVVPSEEQSWISQAISRHRPLYSKPFPFSGGEGYTISGTPADCANLGIHVLYPEEPEYVFSGINFGINVGLPFHMNSGTIGGANQAFLSGVPAAGFSVEVPKDLFLMWKNMELEALAVFEPQWLRVASIAVSVAKKLIEAQAWQQADVFSINLPWEAKSETDIRLTKLERRRYEGIFVEQEAGCYVHGFKEFSNKKLADRCRVELPGDITTVQEGAIAITPFCPPGYPEQEALEELKQKLE